MCGIVCAFDIKDKAAVLRPQILEMAKSIRLVLHHKWQIRRFH